MDLEKLEAMLREAGMSPDTDEYKRIVAAATPVEEAAEETPEEREVETPADAAADAVDELASARAATAAAEAGVGALSTLLEAARGEITVLNESIGDLNGFRSAFEARYGVLTSDDAEASERAGEAADEAPLASEEEFTEASNYELSVGLFRNILDRFADRYGDAPIPEGATPTARSLAYVRRVQGTVLAGEAPSFR